MKTNPLITIRNKCPTCEKDNMNVIYSISCSDSRYQQFLALEPTYSDAFFSEFNELMNDVNFEVAKCVNCGMIFQTFVLSDAGMKKYYEEWISDKKLEEYRAMSNHSDYYRSRIKFVEFMTNIKQMKILDWGAGTGEFCSIAKSLEHKPFAYEFSEERIKTMNRLGIEVINEADLEENYFDFINIDQVLEHLSWPLGELKKIARYLKNDGVIFVSTPNCLSIEKLLINNSLTKKTFEQISPHQHINAFNNKTLRYLCESAGMVLLYMPFIKALFDGKLEKKWVMKNYLKLFFATSFFLVKTESR